MQVKRTQAHSLRCELEDGLEKWRQQVLEVQENNIRRAEMVAEGTRSLRRQRSREDRRSRERRVMERRRASREREEEELRAKQEVINEKQKRVSGYNLFYVSFILTRRCDHNQINLATSLSSLCSGWHHPQREGGVSGQTEEAGRQDGEAQEEFEVRHLKNDPWASESVIVAGCCMMGCWTVQNTDILMSWIIWITYYRIGRLSTVWQKPWSQECHYDQDDISDQGQHDISHQDG